MTSTQITSAVTEGQAIGDAILEAVGALDPGAAIPAAFAETILNLLAKYIEKAVGAYSAASGTPITADSIAALLPNQTPLTPPDAA